jgi:hypothetical protein
LGIDVDPLHVVGFTLTLTVPRREHSSADAVSLVKTFFGFSEGIESTGRSLRVAR